jgi:hypothetical protein
MGTDIHPYLEVKVNDKWHYIGLLQRDRNYVLFGLLSGVRSDNEPFGFLMPNSVPSDCSKEIKEELENDFHDFHSLTIIYYPDLKRFNIENPGFYTEDWEKVMSELVKAFSCEARVVAGYDS